MTDERLAEIETYLSKFGFVRTRMARELLAALKIERRTAEIIFKAAEDVLDFSSIDGIDYFRRVAQAEIEAEEEAQNGTDKV